MRSKRFVFMRDFRLFAEFGFHYDQCTFLIPLCLQKTSAAKNDHEKISSEGKFDFKPFVYKC